MSINDKADLAYLWSKNTIFESADINLSDSYFFIYDYKNKLFHINKKEKMKAFWGCDNLSIIGIVGENGSGKTRILKYIRDEKYINSNCEELRVFIFNNRIEIYYKAGMVNNILYNSQILDSKQCNIFKTINSLNQVKQLYSSGIYKTNKLEYNYYFIDELPIICIEYHEDKDDWGYNQVYLYPSEKRTIVYFNNSLDFFSDARESINEDEFENIDFSTNFSLQSSESQFRESINNNQFTYRPYTNIYLDGQFKRFIAKEQLLTLRFLIRKRKLFQEIISFKSLDSFVCRIKDLHTIFEHELGITPDKYQKLVKEKFDLARTLLSRFREVENKNIYYAIDVINFYLYDIYGLVNSILSEQEKPEPIFQEIKNYLLQILESSNIDNLIAKLKKLTSLLSKHEEIKDEYFELKSIEVNYIIEFVNFIIKFGRPIKHNEINLPLYVDVDNVSRIIDAYYNSNLLKRYITFDYSQLSTGEKNLLVFYSRLFQLVSTNKYNTKIKNNIVFLLDEPDVTFHPEWSRRFIDSLVIIINDLLPEKNVKVIITTHSPFILSDIPSENVIFLKYLKERSKRLIIYRSNEDGQTFANNIHSLLSDSFFLEYTMGEFSRKKIISIIDRLQSNNIKIGIDELTDIYKVIQVIGEPILKRKLLQLYNERLNNSYTIEEKIKNLQEQILLLEKQRNIGENYDKN